MKSNNKLEDTFIGVLELNAAHSQLSVSYSEKIQSGPICCSGDIYRFLMKVWDKGLISLQEQVNILYLNRANKVICWRCLNTGTNGETLFDIKFGLACALGCMASKIIIAHNHPSGILRPSTSDIVNTERFKLATELMDIQLLDHLIVTAGDYFSFTDNGILKA